ncbi:MAG: hypothetical protein M3071_24000, partial [Actinomycetota bacterium]|nr:hypothetical protein [Actinomycetota bacterium]
MSRQGLGLRAVVVALGAAAGVVVGLYVIGLIVTWVSFAAARLPGDAVTSALGIQQLFGAGLRSTALTGAAFVALCLLAYLTATFRWEVNGQEWHDIVSNKGVAQARPDPRMRAEQRAVREQAYLKRKREARSIRRQKLGALIAKPGPGTHLTPPRAKKPAAPAAL